MNDDRKRPRTDEEPNNNDTNGDDDGDDDDAALLQLLDGDDFVTKASQEADEANRRRARRRQRLAQLQQIEPTNEGNRKDNPDDNTRQREKVPLQMEERVPVKMEDDSMQQQEPTENAKNDDNDDDEEFDMFSSSVSPVDAISKPSSTTTATKTTATTRGHEQRDWDDAEGYYKAVIGETIEIQQGTTSRSEEDHLHQSQHPSTPSSSLSLINFQVSGVVGKGVFSTVLKCTTLSNTTSIPLPPTVAMKCVRHNETMAKAATQEIHFLQKLQGSRGIIPLLLPLVGGGNKNNMVLEYRGHVLLVFPFFEYNLRDVLQKFGKGVGLALSAVKSYFGQLFAAATHLKKHGIIHADIKPDNILVRGDFATVQLADFGSAFESTAPENQPTPYLVSRFYRAPEIILGLVPTIAVDLWSLAVTVAEVFLGEVVFRGKSNNDMLYVFQQCMGPFSNRVIRQHMVQSQKMPNVIPRHFRQEGTNYCFAQQTVDPISGEPVHKVLSLANNSNHNSNKPPFPSATPLHQKILKAKSATDSKASVLHFSDLLQKCLVLDPSRRIALKDALQHPFFFPADTTTG